MGAIEHTAKFGTLLRAWRAERRLSQADLAHTTNTPPRHISFLETGRSNPSRRMIARLASALEIPLRDRNALLMAAGYANIHANFDISDTEMQPLRAAVTRMMHAHDPFPSFVIDNGWNVLDTNEGGRDMLSLVSDNFPYNPPHVDLNLLDAVFSPAGFRRYIVNWEDYARRFIQRLHQESTTNKQLSDALARVRHYSELPSDWWAFDVKHAGVPAFPIEMTISGRRMTYFTVVASIALPTNAVAQDLRVETMFPADRETENTLRQRR